MQIQLNDEIFRTISEIVTANNYECYVIGGYVRDIFLERNSKDIDIVVKGSGIDLARQVSRRLGKGANVSVFKNFGTANVSFMDYDIEFVGARKESYSRDSRKPVVENGTIKDDQDRRDFTINTLAVSLHEKNFGELTDPFSGLDDIKNKMIRTPLEPDRTFSDDPLRMMRAVRFAAQLDFTIDSEAMHSIRKNKERITIISAERIADELNKIMLTDKPSKGFHILDKTGLLEILIPEINAMKGVDVKEGKGHKDNFYHSLKVLDNVSEKSVDLWLRWTALLHDMGKPRTKRFEGNNGWTFHGHEVVGARMVPELFRRLKLPLGNPLKYVQKLVQLHLRPISLTDEEVTDSAIRRLLFEAGDDIDDLMTLCMADITSKNDIKVKKYLKNFELVKSKLIEIEKKDHIRNFQPPVDGALIMETFDIQPCREVGVIKNSIKDAILDGVIKNDYHEAFDFMLKKAEELGLERKK
jgi:poly(A) polymerase